VSRRWPSQKCEIWLHTREKSPDSPPGERPRRQIGFISRGARPKLTRYSSQIGTLRPMIRRTFIGQMEFKIGRFPRSTRLRRRWEQVVSEISTIVKFLFIMLPRMARLLNTGLTSRRHKLVENGCLLPTGCLSIVRRHLDQQFTFGCKAHG
jgi:hypothetical protein